MLNGAKMWITNGDIADVAVVGRKPRRNPGIHGAAQTPGSSRARSAQAALRASTTSELILRRLRFHAVLPDAKAVWRPVMRPKPDSASFGSSRRCAGIYETALDHASYGRNSGPHRGFQLTQRKLVEMLTQVNNSYLLPCTWAAQDADRLPATGRLAAHNAHWRPPAVRAASWAPMASHSNTPSCATWPISNRY